MTKEEFFVQLAKSALSEESSDQDVLAVMVVLHTHCFRPKEKVTIDDAGGAEVLAAITRRHASEVAARIMGEMGGNGESEYWYLAYDQHSPFEVVQDISNKWIELTNATIERMKESILDDLFPD